MPSVRNDTTPSVSGMRVMTRLASGLIAAVGTVGNAIPEQHPNTHVEHECPLQLPQ